MLDDAVADGETEAGALAKGHRRIEWIEYLAANVLRNAWSIVREPCLHRLIVASSRAYQQLALAFHGIVRVEDEVQEDLPEKVGVSPDAGKTALHPGGYQHALAEAVAGQIERIPDEAIDGHPIAHPFAGGAGEAQESLDNPRRPLDSGIDPLQALIAKFLVAGILEQQLGGAGADAQGVADLVGDPPGHRAKRNHLLRLDKLGLERLSFRQVPAHADEAADRSILSLDRRPGP